MGGGLEGNRPPQELVHGEAEPMDEVIKRLPLCLGRRLQLLLQSL